MVPGGPAYPKLTAWASSIAQFKVPTSSPTSALTTNDTRTRRLTCGFQKYDNRLIHVSYRCLHTLPKEIRVSKSGAKQGEGEVRMHLHPSLWLALAACAVDATLLGQDDNQAVLSSSDASKSDKDRPKNVVFILSDDQDAAMDSVLYMPLLRKHLAEQGTTFTNHFTTTAICCPSRVSLWTGKQPHNTNVTDVNPPYGKVQIRCLNLPAPLTVFPRWISKVRCSRPEQQLSPRVASRSGLQHILHRKALQFAHHIELRLTLPRRMDIYRLPPRPRYIFLPQPNLPEQFRRPCVSSQRAYIRSHHRKIPETSRRRHHRGQALFPRRSTNRTALGRQRGSPCRFTHDDRAGTC